MRWATAFSCLAILLTSSLLGACGVPRYDVPYNPTNGLPTVTTIIQRIQCELRELVVSPTYGRLLLNQDFDILVALSVEVNDSGGLTPSLAYLNPPASFTFSASATLSGSRDHTFTENLQFSARQIYTDWYSYQLAVQAGLNTEELGLTAYECPQADTNLAGQLGIVDFVAMASRSDNLNTSSDKVFGGTISFIVTKNVNAAGPTWSLVHFKGPGGLIGVSQINTDKIVLSFAQGADVGKRMILPTLAQIRKFGRPVQSKRELNQSANMLLQQQLTGAISSQLTFIQNNLATH